MLLRSSVFRLFALGAGAALGRETDGSSEGFRAIAVTLVLGAATTFDPTGAVTGGALGTGSTAGGSSGGSVGALAGNVALGAVPNAAPSRARWIAPTTNTPTTLRAARTEMAPANLRFARDRS